MACKVITQFRTKPGNADGLIALLKKYVPESARFAGCLEICIQQNQYDPNDIISNQYWETRKHYEDYFTWRTKEGSVLSFNPFALSQLRRVSSLTSLKQRHQRLCSGCSKLMIVRGVESRKERSPNV